MIRSLRKKSCTSVATAATLYRLSAGRQIRFQNRSDTPMRASLHRASYPRQNQVMPASSTKAPVAWPAPSSPCHIRHQYHHRSRTKIFTSRNCHPSSQPHQYQTQTPTDTDHASKPTSLRYPTTSLISPPPPHLTACSVVYAPSKASYRPAPKICRT